MHGLTFILKLVYITEPKTAKAVFTLGSYVYLYVFQVFNAVKSVRSLALFMTNQPVKAGPVLYTYKFT